MKYIRVLFILIFLAPALVSAELWAFQEKIFVTSAVGEKIFHHLDSTGRNNLAASDSTLAAVWEDNHLGSPQVFIAVKDISATSFNKAIKVSTGESAYSPVIRPYNKNSFLISWEQDNQIYIATLSYLNSKAILSKPLKISQDKIAKHATVVKLADGLALAAWSRKKGRRMQIVTTTVEINTQGVPVKAASPAPIDKAPPREDQLYPTTSINNGLVTVAWEDRRTGHTALYYSQTKNGQIFTPYRLLNDIVQKSPDYGRGNGITRVAIASAGKGKVVVTWMDKREFSTGYDIYAAESNSKTNLFGKNQIVQDTLGNDISQWNPTITANKMGDVVIAWDDNRDDTSDIWFSWKTKEGWSDDFLIDPASGEGQQSAPSIAIDKNRSLHAIWIDQSTEFGATKLLYTSGKYIKAK